MSFAYRLLGAALATCVAGLLLAGCFNPPQPDCIFTCNSGTCPSGYTCEPDKFCHKNGTYTQPFVGCPAGAIEATGDRPLVDMAAVEAKVDAPGDTAKGDTVRPDGLKPDSLKPDSLKPDSLKPDSLKPDSLKPDSLKPDSLKPDSLAPDTVSFVTVTAIVANSGSVTSTPAGISCPGTCSAMFASGSNVSLSATPAASASFGSWSGACTGSTSPCMFKPTSSVSATATFVSALSFNGAGSVTVADNAALNPTGMAITVEGWVVPGTFPTATAPAYEAVASKGDPFSATAPTGYQLGFSEPTGTSWFPSFAVVTGTTPTLTNCVGTAATGKHHIAGSYDGTNVYVFIDGVVAGTCAATGALVPATGSALVFGAPSVAETANNSFTGTLDDLQIESVAVTTTFTPARNPAKDANTLGLWPMDEGTGTTTKDASSTAADGTLGASGVTWVPEP